MSGWEKWDQDWVSECKTGKTTFEWIKLTKLALFFLNIQSAPKKIYLGFVISNRNTSISAVNRSGSIQTILLKYTHLQLVNLATFDSCGKVSVVIRGGGYNSPRIYTPVMSKGCIPGSVKWLWGEYISSKIDTPTLR